MPEFLDFPIVDPVEHRLYTGHVGLTKAVATLPADQDHMYRYVRTNPRSVQVTDSLEELLDITNAELKKLREAGAPVISHDWCYYIKEAALDTLPADDGLSGLESPRVHLENTSVHLEALVPKGLILAAKVEVIDRIPAPAERNTTQWIQAYRNECEAGQHRLSDLSVHPDYSASQFAYGSNRATKTVADWMVDIEPFVEITI